MPTATQTSLDNARDRLLAEIASALIYLLIDHGRDNPVQLVRAMSRFSRLLQLSET